MTVEQVRRVLPGFQLRSDCRCWFDRKLSVAFGDETRPWRLKLISVRTRGYKTASGVGVGSTLAPVRKHYGRMACVAQTTLKAGVCWLLTSGTRSVRFVLFSAGTDAMAPKDAGGCAAATNFEWASHTTIPSQGRPSE